MPKKDVAETLLEAVDIVVNKRLEGIKFDTTDVATIIDDKSAKIGKYIVSTGSVSYVAYSNDTTYRSGDCVYVTIPNGDYDNQKIISGKKVSGSEEPYVYVSPFDTMINVTGNLCDIDTSEYKNGWGLVANLPSSKPGDWDDDSVEVDWKSTIHIWDRIFTEENLVGFTRLGIQAQFQSWLSTWKTIFGSYGLLLIVDYQVADSDSFIKNCDLVLNRLANFLSPNVSTQEKLNRWNWITRTCPLANNLTTLIDPQTNEFYAVNAITETVIAAIQNEVNQFKDDAKGQLCLIFDCNRFQGDPYNFGTFYQQETVFDLSQSLGDNARITRLSLYFYEKPSDPSVPEDGYPKQGFKGLNVSSKDINDNDEELPYGDIPYTTGDGIFNNITSPNLWVKDVYICLGYDLGSFNQDSVQLYSISSPTYKYEVPNEYMENDSLRKELEVRWIHEFEEGVLNEVYQSQVKNLNYEIRWYRYSLGAKAPDNYAGVFWERIDTDGRNVFSQIVELDPKQATEKFKVVILLFDEVIRPDQNNGYEQLVISKYQSNILEFTNEENIVNDEVFQAIDGYSLFCIDRSDGNYFIYGQNQTIKDQVEAYEIRQLQCYYKEDRYSTPSPVVQAQYIVWRIPASDSMITLADSFSRQYTDQPTIVEQMTYAGTPAPAGAVNEFYVNEWPGVDNISAEKWFPCPPFSIRRPGEEVIVDLESDGNTYLCKNHNGNWFNGSHDLSNDGGVTLYHILYSRVYFDRSTNEYVFAYKGDANHGYFINPTLEYRVLSHYYEDRFSNTITCEIKTVDNNIYTITKQFQFGPAGTNGSQYTVVINFDDNNDDNDNKYVISADAQEDIRVSATILGPGGHAADLQRNPTYIWEWAEGTYIPGVQSNNLNDTTWLRLNGSIVGIGQWDSTEDRYDYVNSQSHGPNVTLFHGVNAGLLNSLLYLKCTVVGLESYDLVTVVPIAVRKLSTYEKVKGPSIVAYHSDGYVDYTREPFQIQNKTGTAEGRQIFTSDNSGWNIYNPAENPNKVIEGFLGTISLDGHFTPLGNYVEGAGQYGVRCYSVNNGIINYNNILYTQPIYFCINRYSSGAINNWNGKELVIDYDNGLAMVNAISAGKKNSDNTFSGVMMGDWSGDALDTHGAVADQTGIYGFNHGAMSYAFTEDGTGFIGKDGMGRILFDGNKSTIKSGAYQQNRGGMKIDLDDGIIDIKGSNKEANPQYDGYFEIADDVTSSNYVGKRNNLYIRVRTTGVNSDQESYSYYEFVKVANNSTFNPTIDYYYFFNSDSEVKKGTGGKVVQNIYTPSGSRVFISANGPDYLSIKTENPTYSTQQYPITTRGTEILHVGSNSYFLQSDDWNGSEENLYFSEVTHGNGSGQVNASNYTNFYVIDTNSHNYEKDTGDSMNSNYDYYMIDDHNQYRSITVKQYQKDRFYTPFRLDTSNSYTNNRNYYAFDEYTGTFSNYPMIQNLYQQNQYYYRTNTGKMLDPYGQYRSELTYYIKNNDNSFTLISLVSNGDYQPNTYYYYNGSTYVLDSELEPREGREYFKQQVIYEGYSTLEEMNMDMGSPTYNIVGNYKLVGEYVLSTDSFDPNSIYYQDNNGSYDIVTVSLAEEYSYDSKTQYCTYNPQSGFYTTVYYENLQGGVVYYLREYEGLEQDDITEIYNYSEVGFLYVENYYYLFSGQEQYVAVIEGESYDPTAMYYKKENGEFILMTMDELVNAPSNFQEWNRQGILYTQSYTSSNLEWKWHTEITFYDNNNNEIETKAEFDNTNIHYIKTYQMNNLPWREEVIYYVKDSTKDVYDYVSDGIKYNIDYRPDLYYIDYINTNNYEEDYYDSLINLSASGFLNEINAVKNDTKKTYVDYINIMHNNPNSNVQLSKIYRAVIDTTHNTTTFYVLNSSGNEVIIYYNNYLVNTYYYLDNKNNINSNNLYEFQYHGNTYNNDYNTYDYYDWPDLNTKVYFYEPNIYYYSTDVYRSAGSQGDSYNSSTTYYKKDEKSGTKIDIARGNITSYNLTLTGYKTDNQTRKHITITSNTNDLHPYPLIIGVENKENFKVSWDGRLYSTSAEIGGWLVESDAIYSRGYLNSGQEFIKLDSNGNIEANYNSTNKTGWRITKTGDAFFNSGLIAGWTINKNSISAYGGNPITVSGHPDWVGDKWVEVSNLSNGYFLQASVYDASSGTWNYPFRVTDKGHLYAADADISGTVRVENLYIKGEKVTPADVTIPVQFNVDEVWGWVSTGGYWQNGGSWVNVQGGFSRYPYQCTYNGGYTLSQLGGSLYAISIEAARFLSQNGYGASYITTLAGTYSDSVYDSYSYWVNTYSWQRLGYEAYVSKVVKAKIYVPGDKGFTANTVPTWDWLSPSGDNKYKLKAVGNTWIPTETVKLFQTGTPIPKKVYITGEVNMSNYAY